MVIPNWFYFPYLASSPDTQVSAGGCNACEADVNVLGPIAFDLGRFGIQIVTSPRHADGLLITGPVTENLSFAGNAKGLEPIAVLARRRVITAGYPTLREIR